MFNVLAATSESYIDTQILSDLGTLMTTVLGWITSNPILTLFFTVSLVGVGIGIFRGIRSAI